MPLNDIALHHAGCMTDGASATLALAARFFSALERGDKAAVAACYTPDVTIWHNTDRVEQSLDDNMAALGFFFSALTDRRYENVRLSAFEGGFVQQHVLTGRLANGGRLVWPACIICQVRDGLIVRLDEYMDSEEAKAFSA